MSTAAIAALLGVIFLISWFALIVLYGKSQKKIGETKKENDDVGEKQEREAKAKQIESEPAPNTPDAVADIFERMRSNGNKQASRSWRFPSLPWFNKR